MNNKKNELNFNLNINQINNNQLNQNQNKPHHSLTRNSSMNNLYSNHYSSLSFDYNNGINMTQNNFQYNYNNFNTINFNQNGNQFFNNNNQINIMNNSFIMNMNCNNSLKDYFNINNNKKGLRRQMSATNLLEIKDVCPDVNEEKKLIIFERNDKRQFRVKVPCSLRMVELYYFAEEFKANRYSKMELFYNNKYLKDDDSKINIISNSDKVIIAENEGFSFYKNVYLKNISSNDEIVNIIFRSSYSNDRKNMSFSKKTKIRDMFNMFFQEINVLGKGQKFYRFLLNSTSLDVDDDSPLGDIFNSDGKTIIVDKIKELDNDIKGKKLEVEVQNERKKLSGTSIGTFNQIKELYLELERKYSKGKIIQRITIKGKEIIRDDERTLFSINVRDNFKCNIHFVDEERENNKKCIIF